ncbi:MAG: DNA polymerase III subunit beta, partial [Planctomycetota bacterium]
MQIRCHRPTLSAAFAAVSGVVPARTPKEILKNIHLVADAGTLTLVGTDQEIGLRYELTDIELDTPGETLLPAARVGNMLRELTDDAVDIAVQDDGVRIACGHSEFKLSPNDPAEFPPVPKFEEAHYIAVNGGVLKTAIGRTVIATDTESTRYALGGVLLEPEAEKFTFAATDSRRLAVVEAPSRFENEPKIESEGPVVPSKAMQLIARSIDDEEAEVLMAVHANDVLVKSGPVTISSRLVQGRFPKYRAVIPNETPINIDMVA